CFFFSSRRRHTRFSRDWSSDVCSSDLVVQDWYADLLRLYAEDPDPETDLATRLDVRIKRQLAAFGISPDSLNADLRARLGSSPRSEERRVGKAGRGRWTRLPSRDKRSV